MITWLASSDLLKQAEPVLTAKPRMSSCSVIDSPSTKWKVTLAFCGVRSVR